MVGCACSKVAPCESVHWARLDEVVWKRFRVEDACGFAEEFATALKGGHIRGDSRPEDE